MAFTIQDVRPIWQQLATQLRQRMAAGEYPAGSRFPSVRELAAEAGVNPNTMQRAVSQLEAERLVVTNRTAGRTVTEDEAVLEGMRVQLARERTSEYFSEMKILGYDSAGAVAFAERERSDRNE